MDFTFPEILIILLIGLLFAKDYLLPPLLKKLGLGNMKNGNGYQKQINELHEHAKTSNDEVGKIKDDISEIKERLISLEVKIDLLMKHFKL